MNPTCTISNPSTTHFFKSLLLQLLTECCNLTARLIGMIHSWDNYTVHTVKNKWTQQLSNTHTESHTELIRRRQLLHHKHRRLWMLSYLSSGWTCPQHGLTFKNLEDEPAWQYQNLQYAYTNTQTHKHTRTANTITCNA